VVLAVSLSVFDEDEKQKKIGDEDGVDNRAALYIKTYFTE
jgi:hypothetical protein